MMIDRERDRRERGGDNYSGSDVAVGLRTWGGRPVCLKAFPGLHYIR